LCAIGVGNLVKTVCQDSLVHHVVVDCGYLDGLNAFLVVSCYYLTVKVCCIGLVVLDTLSVNIAEVRND
jgi:hypothetical protein